MNTSIVYDIGILIIVATFLSVIMYYLKQPLILTYLLTGIIIGPVLDLGFISHYENIEIISEIGLLLLLFMIGLELEPQKFVNIFKKIYYAGVGQFLITVGISYVLFFYIILPAFFTVFSGLDALYLGVCISLGSTAIVVKTLYDNFEMNTYSGELTLGILIFQDIWAILFLSLQPNIQSTNWLPVFISLAKIIGLLFIAFFSSKYILRYILEKVSKSSELVIIISIGWCASVVGLSKMMDISIEMGALIAGLSVASMPYNLHVTAKILPLRDFFLILYFASLGMKMAVPTKDHAILVIIITVLVFILRLATIVPLYMLQKGSFRNSFRASLNLSQISEFSLIIALLGVKLKHISHEIFLILLYSMSFMAIISSYLFKYKDKIFKILGQTLFFITKKHIIIDDHIQDSENSSKEKPTIFLLGAHHGAKAFLNLVSIKNPKLLSSIKVIDFNEAVLRKFKTLGVSIGFGDISDRNTLEFHGIQEAKVIISTISDFVLKGTTNKQLAEHCRSLNPEAFLIMTAEVDEKVPSLKEAGANKIVLPHFESATYLLNALDRFS